MAASLLAKQAVAETGGRFMARNSEVLDFVAQARQPRN